MQIHPQMDSDKFPYHALLPNIRKFVEVKVRMTPERRTVVQEHASSMEESTTAFINRAIDETMARDQEKKSSS